MIMEKANLLLFDGKDFTKVTCGNLDDYYKHLGCDTFDIARRRINGTYYDMFVDDIGLFRENILPTAIDLNGNVMLVGNIIFANHDDLGNTTSLSDDDVENIMDSIVIAFDLKGNMLKCVLCDY